MATSKLRVEPNNDKGKSRCLLTLPHRDMYNLSSFRQIIYLCFKCFTWNYRKNISIYNLLLVETALVKKLEWNFNDINY